MATLSQTLKLNDAMSGVLQRINSNLTGSIDRFERMQDVSSRSVDNRNLVEAKTNLDQIKQSAQGASGGLGNMRPPVDDFSDGLEIANQRANGLGGTIQRLIIAAGGLMGLKKAMDLSDELVQTEARINNINDGMQTTAELQNMIFQSAQRSRGSYVQTAQTVANLNSQAREAFASNKEAIKFAELLNKTFVNSGTSIQGAESVMYNLTQALGSGVLRGQDLNAVMSNTPQIMRYVADYMDIPIGQIRQMAEEGLLSAEVIKQAMFAAAGDIDATFADMPMTFGQIWQSFKNEAIVAFEPVLMKMNELANNEAIQSMIQGILTGLTYVASVLYGIVDYAILLAETIQDNWSWIEPMAVGIGAAILLWSIYQGVLALETWAVTAAQWALNSAMLANPVFWIIMGIGALIAIIYNWIKAVGGVQVAWLIFQMTVARVWSGVKISTMEGVFAVLNMIDRMQLGFERVKAGISNAVGAMNVRVLSILENMVNGVISLINDMINAVNKIPGVAIDTIGPVSFAANAAIQEEAARQQREAKLESIAEQNQKSQLAREKAIQKMQSDADAKQVQFQNKINAIKAEAAAQAAATAGSTGGAASYDAYGGGVPEYSGSATGGGGGSLGNIDKNTGRMADAMDISKEDLKYLREIAERDVINRFTTAEINVELNANNNINSLTDLDGMVEYLSEKLESELVAVAEGVRG